MLYSVQFRSLRSNTLYEVQIATSSPNGSTYTQLTPADNPVEIEEEGDFDPFATMRTKTGYVAIITDEINVVRDLIPQKHNKHSVVVTKILQSGQKPIFYGYIKPWTPNFKVWGGKQKLKIPIYDWLEGLKYREVDTGRFSGNMMFAHILRNILQIGNAPINYVYTQGILSLYNRDIKARWMDIRVNTNLFKHIEGMTYYDMLDSICVNFGWTCRTKEQDLYLMAYRHIDAANTALWKIAVSDLSYQLNNNIQSEMVAFQSETFLENALADNKSKLSFTQTIKDATVTCNLISPGEEYELPVEDMIELLQDDSLPTIWISTYQLIEKHYDETTGEFMWDVVNNGGFNSNNNITFPISINSDWTIMDSYNTVWAIDKGDSSDIQDWKFAIIMSKSNTSRFLYNILGKGANEFLYTIDIYSGYFTLRYNRAFTAPTNGRLYIDLQGKSEGEGADNQISYSVYNPQTGKYWYLGQWGDNELYNIQKIGEKDDYNSIPVNQGDTFNGLVIKFRPYLYAAYQPNWYQATINGITLTFKSTDEDPTINSEVSKIEAKEMNDNGEEEISIDAIYTTKVEQAPANLNTLINSNGTGLTGIYADMEMQDSYNPVYRLAREIIDETNETKMTLDVALQLAPDVVSPRSSIVMPGFANKYFYPTAFSYNLRDEETRIKMIERESTSWQEPYSDEDVPVT